MRARWQGSGGRGGGRGCWWFSCIGLLSIYVLYFARDNLHTILGGKGPPKRECPTCLALQKHVQSLEKTISKQKKEISTLKEDNNALAKESKVPFPSTRTYSAHATIHFSQPLSLQNTERLEAKATELTRVKGKLKKAEDKIARLEQAAKEQEETEEVEKECNNCRLLMVKLNMLTGVAKGMLDSTDLAQQQQRNLTSAAIDAVAWSGPAQPQGGGGGDQGGGGGGRLLIGHEKGA